MRYSKWGRRAAPLCAALLWATVVQAQETINHASVSGRVIDSQAGVIAGAQVTARQTETNVKTEAVTDVDGRFRLPYLRVGPYEIRVHRDGFTDDQRSLALSLVDGASGEEFDSEVGHESTIGVARPDLWRRGFTLGGCR